MDHIIPRVDGPRKDHLPNLAPSCAPCNVAKGHEQLLHYLLARRSAGSDAGG